MGDWLRGLESIEPATAGGLDDSTRNLDAPNKPSTRPLSDIRELTEPSLIDILARRSGAHMRYQSSLPNIAAAKHHSSLRRAKSNNIKDKPVPISPSVYINPPEAAPPSSSSYSTVPEQSSFYAIPQSIIPRRSSSQTHVRQHSFGHVHNSPIQIGPLRTVSSAKPRSMPNRGRGRSPVKEAQSRLDPEMEDAQRRMPSRTCIRNPPPIDILEYRDFPHHRVEIDLQVTAPVFAGGGTVEGLVKIVVDGNRGIRHKEVLRLCGISVDLLGYEEVGDRRSPFLALGTELIDTKHPPPTNMIEQGSLPLSGDKSWKLVSSYSTLSFMLTLPLDTGPPPFKSAKASIVFLLSVTPFVRVDGRPYRPVRSSRELQILPTYDPEKALTCLRTPLTVSDEYQLPRTTGRESIRLTAGLHRQVWVSGSSIFVDIHISNKSRKSVRRLDLELERNILIYKHGLAASGEQSMQQMRVFEEKHRSTVTMQSLRSGASSWDDVEPQSSEMRTYSLELPRGHATVRCGNYFEVRFFLNITASISNTKLVSVQLPIILIHINSLDVVPNSVAQVAAAIEERRKGVRRRRSEVQPKLRQPLFQQRSISSCGRANNLAHKASFTQGRAFTAPREQSLNFRRGERADLHHLANVLDSSPRKHAARLHATVMKAADNVTHLNTRSFVPKSHNDRARTPNKKKATFADLLYSTPTPPSTSSTPYRHSSADSSTRHPKRSFDFPFRPSPPHPPKMSLAPHSLGLTSATNQPQSSLMLSRPYSGNTSMSDLVHRPTPAGVREKLDRSRFEFKAVRRKASGNLVERGKGWWDGWRVKRRNRSRLREGEQTMQWPAEGQRVDHRDLETPSWI